MNYKEKEKVRSGWNEFIGRSEPKYHITITYPYDIDITYSNNIIKKLVKMINKEYFNHNKNKSSIEGFVVNEKQKLKDRPHNHLFIKNNHIFEDSGKSFTDILIKKMGHFDVFKYNHIEIVDDEYDFVRVSKNNKKTIIVKIQDYRRGTLEPYLTKSIFQGETNFDFIRPLTYDGFSDV